MLREVMKLCCMVVRNGSDQFLKLLTLYQRALVFITAAHRPLLKVGRVRENLKDQLRNNGLYNYIE